MKTKLNLFAVGLAGCLVLPVNEARANLEVSLGVRIQAVAEFDAPLQAHGTWVTVGTYGRCWRPARVAVEWRPYCSGQWVWTDCGWYWESDEPWAWACYHYGYWVYDPGYGWVWIPGVEWAPAWVEWRVGGGYIGWAPCGPAHISISLGAPHFVFVQTTRFHEPLRPSHVIVNNTTVINHTTVINNIRQENRTFGGGTAQRVIVNEGPGVEVVQRAAGRKFTAVKIQDAARRTKSPASIQRQSGESPGRNKPATTMNDAPKASPEIKRAPETKIERTPPPVTQPERRQPFGSPREPVYPRRTPPGHAPERQPDDSLAPPNQPPNPEGQPSPAPKQKGKRTGHGEPDEKEKRGHGKP